MFVKGPGLPTRKNWVSLSLLSWVQIRGQHVRYRIDGQCPRFRQFSRPAQRGELQSIRDLLLKTTKLVADRYESNSLGLAATDASSEEEVDRLLGDPFEHIQIDRRAKSYIARVVLDLAAIVGLGDVLETAINEFLAVELFPTIIESPDTTAQYVINGGGLSFTPNIEYSESWQPQDGWKAAPDHKRARSDYYLQRIGRYWDHLALSSVLRDRHYLVTCRHFLTA
jgi:hypothetical protein